MQKRILSILLTLAMVLTMLPVSVFATDSDPIGASGQTTCNHIHDTAICGYIQAVTGIPCDKDCTDTYGDDIINHADECAFVQAVEGADCNHLHNEDCGGLVQAQTPRNLLPCATIDEAQDYIITIITAPLDQLTAEQKAVAEEHLGICDLCKQIYESAFDVVPMANTTVTNATALANALSDAYSGDTIILGADISVRDAIMFSFSENVTATLNLNGHTITYNGSGNSCINMFASGGYTVKLIITGSGGITSTGSASAISLSNFDESSTVELDVQSGTISAPRSGNTAIYADNEKGTTNVTFSGGTIIGGSRAFETSSSSGTGTNFNITGGSIIGTVEGSPKNSSNAPVYLTTITLSGISTATDVTAIEGATGYGTTGMKTDSSGKIHLYLPVGTTVTSVTAGGATYTGTSVTVAANNNNAATFSSGPSITISTQPTATTTNTYGSITGSLSVAGTASNSSAVTYQWYSNATNSNTGGTAVAGATTSSFTIPTNLDVGDYYYYCVLKATGCADVTSNVAKVTVGKATYPSAVTKEVGVKINQSTAPTGTLTANDFFATVPTNAAVSNITGSASNVLVATPTLSSGTLSWTAKDPLISKDLTDTFTVTITSKNYNNITATLNFKSVDKTPVTITATVADKTYDGTAVSQPTPTAVITSGGGSVTPSGYTFKWQESDGSGGYTDLSPNNPPKDAGSYRLVVAVSDSDANYTGSKNVDFTVAQKAITIKPKNFSVTKGATMPTFILDYSGVVSGENLTPSAVPIFSCTATDTNTIGSYTITWSNESTTTFTGAVVDNYAITKTATGQFDVTVSGGSTGSYGGSGSSGGSYTPPVVTPKLSPNGVVGTIDTTKVVDTKAATTAVTNAINALPAGSKQVDVLFKDVSSLSPEAAKAIADAAATKGVTATIMLDHTEQGQIVSRIYVDAAALAKIGTLVDLRVDPTLAATKPMNDSFTKYFDNKIRSIALGNQGTYGITVEIAAKVDLKDMNTKSLYFYTYDKKTNIYERIANPGHFIDTKGYLHFKTVKGGNIIITDSPLKLK